MINSYINQKKHSAERGYTDSSPRPNKERLMHRDTMNPLVDFENNPLRSANRSVTPNKSPTPQRTGELRPKRSEFDLDIDGPIKEQPEREDNIQSAINSLNNSFSIPKIKMVNTYKLDKDIPQIESSLKDEMSKTIRTDSDRFNTQKNK